MNAVTIFPLIALLTVSSILSASGNTEPGNTKDAEDTDGPGMLADGRSPPKSQLEMGLKKPVLPLKELFMLKTQFKERGYEMENFDEETGLIILRDIWNNGSNMSSQATPTETEKINPNSLKMNTTNLAVATNAILKTAPTSNAQKNSIECPTFRTMVDGTVKFWTGLKKAQGVKEGVSVVVNATQLTFASIWNCMSLFFSKIGDWVKGAREDASVSLPPAVTADANKTGVEPSNTVNIPPSDVKHDRKEEIRFSEPTSNILLRLKGKRKK